MISRSLFLLFVLFSVSACAVPYTLKDCMREYPVLVPKDQCIKHVSKSECKERFQLLEKDECPACSSIVRDIFDKCITKNECLELCKREEQKIKEQECDYCSKRCGIVCDIVIPPSLEPKFKIDEEIPHRLTLIFPIGDLSGRWIIDFSYSIRGCLAYDYIITCSNMENCERKFKNGFRILYPDEPCFINYWVTLKDVDKKCGVAIQKSLTIYDFY